MVMRKVVQFNDWLDEEVDNMAREGLRTLVMSKKTLSSEHYLDFEQKYKAAKLSLVNRSAQGIFIYWVFFQIVQISRSYSNPGPDLYTLPEHSVSLSSKLLQTGNSLTRI